MTGTLILVLLSVYMLALFAVAWRADRKPAPAESAQRRAIVYGLSIAVYFTSWTYYGAVGTAARTGWQYLPIFLGPILALTVFFPLWRKIAVAAKRENVGSVADFLASRYGKNRILGTVVACVLLVGTMPYIALQLKSLSTAWVMASGPNEFSDFAVPIIAAVLAGFAILFGARRPTLTEHSRGLVRAIALESIVKLAALASVAVLALVIILSSHQSGVWTNHLGSLAQLPHIDLTFINATLLSFAAVFCLPRQFHVSFVELENTSDLRTARWLLPSYLIVACLVVIPIVVAGALILQGDYKNPDMYVLEMPLQMGGPLLTALVFLGGFSAAAAMVTVESVALSAMISNELVLPLLARTRWQSDPAANIGRLIVNVRRGAILLIMFLGWLYFHAMNQSEALGQIGLTSFAAVAQLLPALIGGVLWRRGHSTGAIWGICAGFGVWLYAVAGPQLLPHLPAPGWIAEGMLSSARANELSVPSVIFSLVLNTALYIGFSVRAHPRLIDRIQAAAFVDAATAAEGTQQDPELHGTIGDIRALVGQFVGHQDATRAFDQIGKERGRRLRDSDRMDASIVRAAERMLAGAIGASLARSVIGWQLAGESRKPTDVMRVLDEAAQALQFNRELLHTTLDNLSQGVSVVDEELRLVAWNSKYIELFEFPAGFIYAGKPIEEVIRYGTIRAGYTGDEVERQVERRLTHIRRRQRHVYERDRPDGTVLKILGSPMPGGRYVTSFTDVTELRSAARALSQANELLEERVASRTRELTEAIKELGAAKAVAERATNSQARFLAAASHDVLQPLQAARLFIGTLAEDRPADDLGSIELLRNADLSIESADRLLRALLNLSRLEVGGVRPEVRPVDVAELLHELQREFEPVANEKGLVLRVVPSEVWVLSDPDLLRSVLQNLIANAIRYTRAGNVLVGCRKDGHRVRFEVRDSGPGIPEDAFSTIFNEFSRLPHGVATGPGAGLGLSIAERVCKLLGHPLTLRSRLGEGSTFAVTVPRTPVHAAQTLAAIATNMPIRLRVLYVENETAVLQAMEALLTKIGASVSTAVSMEQALALRENWDVILADYHLEQDGNGLDLMEAMLGRAKVFALLTANPTEVVIERAASLNVEVIRKPASPLLLRSFLERAEHLAAAAE